MNEIAKLWIEIGKKLDVLKRELDVLKRKLKVCPHCGKAIEIEKKT